MTPEEIREKAVESDHGNQEGKWCMFRCFCVRTEVMRSGYRWVEFGSLSDEVLEKAYEEFKVYLAKKLIEAEES